MAEKHPVVFIGGPDAGKSNYLFRLWMAIQAEVGELLSDRLPADLEYLETGASSLLHGAFAPHTPHEVQAHCSIPVKLRSKPTTALLAVPDYSGEQWMRVYRMREWPKEIEDCVTDSSSFLFFVRPDSPEVERPLDWLTCERLLGGVHGINPTPKMEYRPPTQNVIVDWLQCLRAAYNSKIGPQACPRVAIVVSAWDLVPNEQQLLAPVEYLTANFPMVADFIATNKASFEIEVFGLSIVGGDLKNEPGFRERYLSGDPQESGYVVHTLRGRPQRENDISRPVLWALNL
jgi:hypothetical protein